LLDLTSQLERRELLAGGVIETQLRPRASGSWGLVSKAANHLGIESAYPGAKRHRVRPLDSVFPAVERENHGLVRRITDAFEANDLFDDQRFGPVKHTRGDCPKALGLCAKRVFVASGRQAIDGLR